MKRAVSLSLGTSRRNFSTRLEIFGEEVEVRRIGCDGDLRQLASLLRHFDGRVQALGLGGMNFAYRVGARAYAVAQAAALRRLVRRTPLVDGSLLKDTVERRLVVYLTHEYGLDWPSLRVLVVSALDRFGLTEALVREGAAVVIGDALFG
ncbi:MAG: quinate 5-dehydrogenase, partial [Clostridia bacterium]|nr:quinate 5-dehydrogenase [Clostridia bacterium]